MPVFVNDYGIKIINMCVIILRERMIDQIAKVSSNFYWEQEITKPEKFIESNPIENHSSPPSYFILPPLQYSRNTLALFGTYFHKVDHPFPPPL